MLVAATIFTKHRQHMVERWVREGGLPPVAGTVVNNLLTAGPVETPPNLVLYGLKEHYRLPKEDELTEACLGDPALAGGMVVAGVGIDATRLAVNVGQFDIHTIWILFCRRLPVHQ